MWKILRFGIWKTFKLINRGDIKSEEEGIYIYMYKYICLKKCTQLYDRFIKSVDGLHIFKIWPFCKSSKYA